ncbi:MAG: response regulator transcription factor [Chitinophagaceae bacterium]|nr:MAG: response regulator transcription factor [Chitinophagaceae bacterium]
MDIKVAIFEDNKLIREALQTIINGSPGFVCTGAFANVNQVQGDIKFSNPEVVLMDIEMPGRTGIEATKILKDEFPEIKVLIQTVFNDNEKIFSALCAGASGYILKTDSPIRQLEAIREVYAGGGAMSTSIAQKVMEFFVNRNVILVTPSQSDLGLSNREKEILALMVQGLSYKDMADKAFISYETIRTHVKHIYKKLHVVCRSEAVLKARQQGIL